MDYGRTRHKGLRTKDYEARARRGLRPLSCAGADGGSAIAAVRLRPRLRMMAIAEAMKIVE